jgi:YD repeat-containing protein
MVGERAARYEAGAVTVGARRALWRSAVLGLLLVLAGAGVAQDGATVRHVYDDLGRILRTIDETGQFSEYVYDPSGNIVEIRRGTVDALAIFAFVPSRGASGDVLRVEGQGFSAEPGENTFLVGGIEAAVLEATPTAVTGVVPPGASTGPLVILVGAASATSSRDFVVLPSITSLSPGYILAGESLDDVGVAGSGLAGAVFSLEPDVAQAPSITDASIDSGGGSATLSIAAPVDGTGEFVLVATTAEGDSRRVPADGNTMRILDGGDDEDGDGLTNAEEQALGSSPFEADTDGDGVPDGITAMRPACRSTRSAGSAVSRRPWRLTRAPRRCSSRTTTS